MCSTGPFQFRWLRGYIHSSCYYHLQIESINLTHYHIFPGCVPDMLVTSYSVTYCIYIPQNRDFVFIIIVQFMMSANSRIRFGLQIVFVCLYITPSYYHHCANFSDDIEHIFCYPLYIIWGCVFSVYPFSLWWLREYSLCLIIIIKSEVWTIIHCLGLGHETMVCAVCLSIFLWWVNSLVKEKWIQKSICLYSLQMIKWT